MAQEEPRVFRFELIHLEESREETAFEDQQSG